MTKSKKSEKYTYCLVCETFYLTHKYHLCPEKWRIFLKETEEYLEKIRKENEEKKEKKS